MVLEFVELAAGFFVNVRLGLIGPVRNESLIAFVPTRTALRVITLSVRWSALLQTEVRLLLVIRHHSFSFLPNFSVLLRLLWK